MTPLAAPSMHGLPLAPVLQSPAVSQVNPSHPFWHLQVKVLIPSLQVPWFEQPCLAQSSMSVWQLTPSYPGLHLHVYLLIPSLQLPWFEHVFPSHSSMFILQLSPVHPASQSQVNWLIPSMHFPLPQSVPSHSSILV